MINFKEIDIVKAMCEMCSADTWEGFKLCNDCWEVQHRLATYLERGGEKARDFVRDALYQAQEGT